MLSTKAIIGILSVLIIIVIVAASISITFLVKHYKKKNDIMKEQFTKLNNENKLLSNSLIQSSTQHSKAIEDVKQKDKSNDKQHDEIDNVIFENTTIKIITKGGDAIYPEVNGNKIVFPTLNKEYLAVQKSFNLDPIIMSTVYILQELEKYKNKYGEAFNEKYYSLYASTSAFIDLYANYILLEEKSKKGMTGQKLLDKAINLYHAFTSNIIIKEQFENQNKVAANKIDALKFAITTKINSKSSDAKNAEAIDNLNQLLNEYTSIAGEYMFNLPKITNELNNIDKIMEKQSMKNDKSNIQVEEQVMKDDLKTITNEDIYEK